MGAGAAAGSQLSQDGGGHQVHRADHASTARADTVERRRASSVSVWPGQQQAGSGVSHRKAGCMGGIVTAPIKGYPEALR